MSLGQTTNSSSHELILITYFETIYGERAKKRIVLWDATMNGAVNVSEQQKLYLINRFFNQFFFINDNRLWGEKNYWANLYEFIGANGGDCEDFVYAKYFSLLQLGVDDKKLRVVMVSSQKLNEYHMVLAYYPDNQSIPLLLDNLDKEIKPATHRKDLKPIHSFNGKDLWLTKKKNLDFFADNYQAGSLKNEFNIDFLTEKFQKPQFILE